MTIFDNIFDDFYSSITGKWKNNLTIVEAKIIFFDSNFLQYQSIILIFFSSLGLIISPFAGYISYSSTTDKLKDYMYFGIYNRICLFIYSLILLLWQPVCLSSMFIIYSEGGILNHFDPAFQFICLWLFLSSALCSNHAIGSELLYLCKLSLLPCKSWYSDPKKFKIVSIFFGFVIFSNIILFWLSFPNSKDSLQDNYENYPFLKTFLSSKKFSNSNSNSILAFNLLNVPITFKIFSIYVVFIISLCLIVFPTLALDYYRTQIRQHKILTSRTQSAVTSLTIGIKIRIVFLVTFLQIPFIYCCICLYFNFPPIYFSICLCMFSMFPFFDAFAEIFTIKFYRQKTITVLSCGYFVKRRSSIISISEQYGNRRFS